ncbi:MAG TPA: MBL fold metallo-hydrolase, partial [Cyclobacteriaceae bacterium]|nr:MBL fold metallo-hydrolase [Cyclobacteriaceae bacterium]
VLALLINIPVICSMGLFVTALNSGSNGNCFYIGNENEAVLVDVGISCRETERRMARLGLSMKKIKAVFISHEHGDHVRGLRVLAKKYQLPVYSTPGTLRDAHLNPDHPFNHILTPYQNIQIGALEITAFPKCHDAHDPQSFIIKDHDLCVGVLTDIGEACEHVIKHFKCCQAIFLETNYDDDMLMNGRYPYHLKRRIAGRFGHLSNQQALELFCEHRSPSLTHLFLSHLSKENNDPELVYNLFQRFAGEVEIVLTSREAEIPLYTIHSDQEAAALNNAVQLSLFS